jgi:hypothetical protein
MKKLNNIQMENISAGETIQQSENNIQAGGDALTQNQRCFLLGMGFTISAGISFFAPGFGLSAMMTTGVAAITIC